MGVYRRLIAFILLLHLACDTPIHAGQKKIDSLQKALSSTSDDTIKVKILTQLSYCLDCKDSTQKIAYLNQALTIAKQVDWNRGIFLVYITLGDVYVACTKDIPKAISTYEAMGAMAREKNDAIEEANALLSLGIMHKQLGNYPTALGNYHKILRLNLKKEATMGIWASIGEIYKSLGDYTKALESYQKSLRIVNAYVLSNKNVADDYAQMQAGLLMTIAAVYESMGDYDRALSNYDKALSIGNQLNQPMIPCVANQGIGHCFQIKKQNDTAIISYQKALKAARTSPDLKTNECEILNQLGEINLLQGAVKDALDYTTAAMKIATEMEDKNNLSTSYTGLGKIYTHTKDYARATNYLKQAINIAHEIGAKVNERNAWEAMSAAYSAMSQPAKALTAYKNFIALRDSVYNADKAKELTRMDMQGDFDRAKAADSVKQADENKITTLKMQRQKALTYSGFAGVALMLLLAFLIYRNYSNEKKANTTISKAHEAVKHEKQVADMLLLNILPADVADELKAHGSVAAKQFDDVTVLFTDFIGFTTSAQRLTPRELVAELHECFKAFDAIMKKYNVEKIKTAGDAYMAAAGLPTANPNHATDIVSAAIEVRDFMLERKQQLGDKTFGIRIGLNSGSVVAGIVGDTKFAYDIWGDTVNTAARMEQNSEGGKINISETTYQLVHQQFTCTYRGEIDAKNKGMMKMYFVSSAVASA